MLGRFVKLIAVLAVCFAALRTPLGRLALAIVLILAGFWREAAKGGHGVIGAMRAGFFGIPLLGLTLHLLDPEEAMPFAMLVVMLCIEGVVGCVVGMVVGCSASIIISLFNRVFGTGSSIDEPPGPIVWRGFEDRGLPHPRAGGHQP